MNAYLAQVTERLQEPTRKPRLSIISSVKVEKDVADTLVSMTEFGDGETGASDLTAISTHGRHGLQRWMMGSVTERILDASKLLILIDRSPNKG